ncbi:MAG TPA: acetylglutamate kinase, partial [Thermosulfidibacter takaii]|nr:acetylglutamate kinase [Thermosulfidibacter takaii]
MERFRPLIERAHILLESLPYIRAFYGKTVVVKYGGHAMVDEDLKDFFAKDVVLMKYIGMHPVVIHGGGPQIGRTMKRMGKTSRFVDGLRVTDDETMDIVEMVLGGKVNKEIVALINKHGGRAVGLTGKDGGLITARKMMVSRESPAGQAPEIIDLGHVGEVVGVDPNVIGILKEGDFIPVIAPVGVDDEGVAYNINADHVAGRVAAALKAERVVFMTDVEGIRDKEGKLISTLPVYRVEELIEDGTITGGMIPKVQASVQALAEGVGKAHIVDGRIPHAILLELFTDEG